MITKLIDDLSKFIKFVEIDGNTIVNNGKNIEIVEVTNKFSSVKKPTMKLKVDDKICKRNDRLTYNCPMCNSSSSILVGRFLTKKSKYCYKCKENDEEKKKKQSEFIIKSYANFDKVRPKEKIEKLDLIELSNILFKKESEEFKKEYFERNLTIEEFEKIRNNIKSINGTNVLNKNIIYYPIVKVNNQMKYSSKVFVDGRFILFTNCEFACEICGVDFKGRNFKSKLDNILCPSCNLSNRIFKFKSTLNIKGEKVVYQSDPELKLIDTLNKNNILIKNGPRISYNFKGDSKIYKVDFEIPDLRQLIEIKADHIWHRDQVKSGMWDSKESAAKKWCSLKNYKFQLVFNVDAYINSLSLNQL